MIELVKGGTRLGSHGSVSRPVLIGLLSKLWLLAFKSAESN